MKEIEDYVASAEFLPPSFHLLPRLLLLLDDLQASSGALAELIRVDPGLTADILRVCNSAAYAGYRVQSVQDAILRLGFSEVHRIVMTVIASPILKNPQKTYARREADLWSHSLAASTASQWLSDYANTECEIAFTGAILHDIGKVVITNAVPEKASAAASLSSEKYIPLYQAERSLMNIDHAEVGARLLEKWGFPQPICMAVRHHHAPADAENDRRLASCLCLSNVLAYRIEDAPVLPEYVMFPDSAALADLKLSQPEFEALADDAREQFATVQKRFR